MDKEKWVIIGLLVLIVISCIFMGSSYGDIYEGMPDKLTTFKENTTKIITENMNSLLLIINSTNKSKINNDMNIINSKLNTIKKNIDDSVKILKSK